MVVMILDRSKEGKGTNTLAKHPLLFIKMLTPANTPEVVRVEYRGGWTHTRRSGWQTKEVIWRVTGSQ